MSEGSHYGRLPSMSVAGPPDDSPQPWHQRPAVLRPLLAGVTFVACVSLMAHGHALMPTGMGAPASTMAIADTRAAFTAGEQALGPFESYPEEALTPIGDLSEPHLNRYMVKEEYKIAHHKRRLEADPSQSFADDVFVTHVLDPDTGEVRYEMHNEVLGPGLASMGHLTDWKGQVQPKSYRMQVFDRLTKELFSLAPLDMSLAFFNDTETDAPPTRRVPQLFYFSHQRQGETAADRVLSIVETVSGEPQLFLDKGREEWAAFQKFAEAHTHAVARGRRLQQPHLSEELGSDPANAAGTVITHEFMIWCPMADAYVPWLGDPDALADSADAERARYRGRNIRTRKRTLLAGRDLAGDHANEFLDGSRGRELFGFGGGGNEGMCGSRKSCAEQDRRKRSSWR